ncbi:translation initiation factor 2 [Mammaliicoccus sciuri]
MNNFYNNNPQGENSTSPEIYAARIGFIGTLLSTLGDGLQSIGAAITLQQLENASIQDTQTQSDQSNQFESMQKQIDHLTKKIERMERKN